MENLKELTPADLLIAAELLKEENEKLVSEMGVLKEENRCHIERIEELLEENKALSLDLEAVREQAIVLSKKATELEILVDAQQKALAEYDLLSTAKSLKEKVAVTKPTIPGEPTTVNGKKYKFKFPRFKFDNVSYTAEEAQFDTKLLEKILARKGQSILREIV